MASASSSISSSPSAQALSSGSWKYNVFLSFRGEDTRKTFVGHLYPALEQAGIYTYKDDETLPRGESIGPSLMKAIEESQIAVIVFSKNYGDSSWCLDELAHIMKCRDALGQIVMPIFYDVDPSEVRKQKRKYGEAFAKHEVENKSKVESWRKALVDASNISGWEPTNIANGDESKGIKQIIVEISQKLQPLTSSADENLVGMVARMQRLRSELQVGSGSVRMIGIWGVGGGGKTTLASAIYDEICRQFDGCCFVQNIREESSRHGLGKLEEDILSEMGINRVGVGRWTIKDRLCHRMVLIVLDDVDRLGQLKALAGSHHWFGEGSRIIITTRDKHLLAAHKVDVIHNVRLLDTDEAMKLFCKHAPRDNRRVEDYEHLSKEVVSYAGGLPLALAVLGSFLCDKDIDEWKSALVRLKEIPDSDILEKLKISFDGLTRVEKVLFLDIACFFRWEDKGEAMKILDACGFHPVIGVKVLIQKALITVSEYGEFDMHDLVQEMGHHIVRGEYPNNPEKHSRVWKEEDILKICATDVTAVMALYNICRKNPLDSVLTPIWSSLSQELDMIEAIRIDNYKKKIGAFQHFPRIVAHMKNLRWIDGKGDFPSLYPPRGLCFLRLDGFLQKQLWEGCKLLPNLKAIQLYRLDKLIWTPDFNGLPNLETLGLYTCRCLTEIHPSIGSLESLIVLSVNNCTNFNKFPPIAGLRKLKIVKFDLCYELFKLSETQQQKMGNLHLPLDYGAKEVASLKALYEIQEENMDTLEPLDLDNSGGSSTNFFDICRRCGCSSFPGVECCPENNMKPCLPDNTMNDPRLELFCKDLENLCLLWCNLGDKDIGSAVWELPNLRRLNLEGNKFSRLNFNHMRLPRLKWLNISYCRDLVELSELPSSIAVLQADYCRSLGSLGDILNCKWLWEVSLLWGGNCDGDVLLDDMLQGNAIEDYFISVSLEHRVIPKGFVGRMFRRRTYALHFPDDWYHDFCGFSICIVTQMTCLSRLVVSVVIKQEVDEDSLYDLSQESNEAVEPEDVYETKTFVGYVSFGSLRHTSFSTSSYTMISVKIQSVGGNTYGYPSYVGAELVPRKCKGDEPQTTKVPTDSSEYWDLDRKNRQPPFKIQHDSKSSIKIEWRPTISDRDGNADFAFLNNMTQWI